MGILERLLEKIPGEVRLVVFLRKKEVAVISLEGEEILVEVKNPVLAIEAILKEFNKKKVESATLKRLQGMGYHVRVKYKGLEFHL